MSWHECEVYVCKDPHCLSEVLVIQGPRTDPSRAGPPTCMCGKVLEKKALGVGEPEELRVPQGVTLSRDPSEEPE